MIFLDYAAAEQRLGRIPGVPFHLADHALNILHLVDEHVMNEGEILGRLLGTVLATLQMLTSRLFLTNQFVFGCRASCVS